MRSVLVQIIESCNFHCDHCSQDAPRATAKAAHGVSLPDIERRFHNLAKAGVVRIRLTGGEPLVHPKVIRVLSLAKSYFNDVSIITNRSEEHTSELQSRQYL